MDYTNIIEQDPRGNYCILFKNKHGLSPEEIKKVFSQFGKVQNIRNCGDSKSYHFIRYLQFHEAKDAVEGLKNHPQIQIGQHKSKTTNNPDNVHKKFNKKFEKGKNFTSNDIDSVKSAATNVNQNVQNFLASINETPVHNIEDELPDLITTTKKETVVKTDLHKKVVRNAEEVIVGNIPDDFGAAYILHLFDRFEPIAISKINIVPNTSIRYCHVYFKTIQHSIQVETLFDKKELSHKKLLVLRPVQLIEEAVH